MKNIFDDGFDLNINEPFIRVKVYKNTGKYYLTQYSKPAPKDLILINENKGFEVLDYIEHGYRNSYSPTGHFYHYLFVIEGFNMDGFFDYILDFRD